MNTILRGYCTISMGVCSLLVIGIPIYPDKIIYPINIIMAAICLNGVIAWVIAYCNYTSFINDNDK